MWKRLPRTFGFKQVGVAVAKMEGSENGGSGAAWEGQRAASSQTRWYFSRALEGKLPEMAEIGLRTPRTSLKCFQRMERLYHGTSKIVVSDLGV